MALQNTNAGSLDERITILRPVQTTDPEGGVITTDSAFSTVWANVKFSTGKEKLNIEKSESSTQSALFKIRYHSNITTENSILFNSQKYNIKSIVPLGKKDALEILATTRTD